MAKSLPDSVSGKKWGRKKGLCENKIFQERQIDFSGEQIRDKKICNNVFCLYL
jgi:hypothetical protein